MSGNDCRAAERRTSRREWMRQAGGGMAAAAAGCALPSAMKAQGARARGPNVLFIGVDDLNDWIGPLGGHPQTQTPHLDALAKRGVTFTPRLLSGAVVQSFADKLDDGPPSVHVGRVPQRRCLAQSLARRGDAAAAFHAARLPRAGRRQDVSRLANDAASWDAYHQFNGFLHPPSTPVNKIPRAAHFDWSALNAKSEETTDTQLPTGRRDYLRREHDRPFFLAVGFYRPHLPWYAPAEHFDRFPPQKTELPATLDGDVDDVPKSALRSFRDHENVTGTGQWNKAVAGYLSCINYADANIGRVLQALEDGPHADNTVIVVWSDHGWQLGEKKQWRKFTLWGTLRPGG